MKANFFISIQVFDNDKFGPIRISIQDLCECMVIKKNGNEELKVGIDENSLRAKLMLKAL